MLFYESHIKNKCFNNDYILESERLYKSVELWADDESKKQYLIKNGVKTSSSHAIRFRQLFLEDKAIDFIGEIKDEDLESGMEFIATADGYSRPFEGENQEKALKYILKEKKCKALIEKWDLEKMVEVAHEWNSPEYNKWKEDHSLKIELYPKKMPHQLFYNNTLVLNYESGHKYYDSSNQRLFISEDNIQKTLLGIIDDKEIPFGSDDYAFLFAVISKDDYDRIDKENELLRDENASLKNELEQLRKRLGINDGHPSNINGDTNNSTTITIQAGRPSSLDKDSQIAAQLEAQKRLMQEFPDWTFPENYGEYDENGMSYNLTTIEVEDENGKAIPIVLKSYKKQDEPFRITAEEWDFLIKEEADLLIYTGSDIKRIFVKDLILNQNNIAISFSTQNLDIEERIDAFAESLHYFKELHFDFDSFNISKKAESVANIYKKNERGQYNNNNTEADI